MGSPQIEKSSVDGTSNGAAPKSKRKPKTKKKK